MVFIDGQYWCGPLQNENIARHALWEEAGPLDRLQVAGPRREDPNRPRIAEHEHVRGALISLHGQSTRQLPGAAVQSYPGGERFGP